MNPIYDGDIVYSIRFEIISNVLGFDTEEVASVEKITFEPTRIYPSKDTAIDAMIDMLLKIKRVDA